MRIQMKTIAVVLTLGMVGYAAYAENVTVSTFYPSPFGSYQTLETSTLQGAAGAGHVWITPAAGNIGIGFASGTNPAAKVDVRGGRIVAADVSGGPTAYVQGINGGANPGAYFGTVGSQSVNIGNSEGNRVVVVDNAAATVNGAVTITGDLNLRTSALPVSNGELQVDCSTGPCYALAVYS